MERPSHSPEIIYSRGGNLAAVTELDREKAQEYMRRTDMRRQVVIVDSDEKPQGQATQVGTDILAWRAIVPINELLATRFRPQPLHTLTRDDADPAKVWQIAVHERVIDERIRSAGFIDRSDYEDQFLRKLNKAVKSGLLEALRREKLGWHDQNINHMVNIMYVASSSLSYNLLLTNKLPILPASMLYLGLYLLFCAPLKNLSDQHHFFLYRHPSSIQPYILDREWRLGLLPIIPIERWLAGKLFLARNRNAMIVRRSGST